MIMLFDFDGTIADTYFYMCEISNRICSDFGYNRIQDSDIAFLKGKTSREIIDYLKIPLLKVPAIVARAKKEYQKGISGIKIADGLKEPLAILHKSGARMGILSSNSRDNVSQVLEQHGLNVFEFIHSTSRIWGKNISLQTLIQQKKLPKDAVVYIGDEIRDILAARRLGIKVAAVAWGYNSRAALAEHKPDFLLKEPRELTALLR